MASFPFSMTSQHNLWRNFELLRNFNMNIRIFDIIRINRILFNTISYVGVKWVIKRTVIDGNNALLSYFMIPVGDWTLKFWLELTGKNQPTQNNRKLDSHITQLHRS